MVAFAISGPKPALAASTLTAGQWLYPNQALHSPNGGFTFVMQPDSNLVLYSPTWRALWASNTYMANPPAQGVTMQTDDNLVIYNTSGVAIWASNTYHPQLPMASLTMQDDGNAVIYRGSSAPWATGTSAGTNTESYGNGDCWRVGTPATCRSNWPGRSQFIRFRAIDQFSDSRPAWLSSAWAAVSAWNSAPGPQLYSFSPQANDTWVYLKDSNTGDHELTGTSTGITWNCRQGVPCDRLILLSESIIAHWTEIYFNRDVLPNASNAVVQSAFAHESGHAMMLRHNSVDPNSLMRLDNTGITGPNVSDTGAFPGCSNGGFGVNCVYGWGN